MPITGATDNCGLSRVASKTAITSAAPPQGTAASLVPPGRGNRGPAARPPLDYVRNRDRTDEKRSDNQVGHGRQPRQFLANQHHPHPDSRTEPQQHVAEPPGAYHPHRPSNGFGSLRGRSTASPPKLGQSSPATAMTTAPAVPHASVWIPSVRASPSHVTRTPTSGPPRFSMMAVRARHIICRAWQSAGAAVFRHPAKSLPEVNEASRADSRRESRFGDGGTTISPGWPAAAGAATPPWSLYRSVQGAGLRSPSQEETGDARSSRTWAGVGTRPATRTFSSTTRAGVDMTP